MAGLPIKFRCYQCNQLMGIPRSKAGRVVNCRKCGAELVVPEPDESLASGSPTASSDAAPAFLADLDAGLPIELADIRPEDIRAIRVRPADSDAPDAEALPAVPMKKLKGELDKRSKELLTKAKAGVFGEQAWYPAAIVYVPEAAQVLHRSEMGVTAAVSTEDLWSNVRGNCCNVGNPL